MGRLAASRALSCSPTAWLAIGGASLVVAFAYVNGDWQRLTRQNQARLLAQPLLGLYLGVRRPVTATLGATSAPSPPPLALAPGWNLVGPSALAGAETYAHFVTGVGAGGMTELADPNGAHAVSTAPATDTGDAVVNGWGCWAVASVPATLPDQIPTGQAQP